MGLLNDMFTNLAKLHTQYITLWFEHVVEILTYYHNAQSKRCGVPFG